MMKMEFKDFLSEFKKYNKKIWKKLIFITIIILYFSFLITYNYWRINLNYSIELSWINGIISALIFTLVFIFIADITWFAYKKRKEILPRKNRK